MASNGTPQSTMYQMRGRSTNDYGRDRSAEQYNATNNGNPNMPMFNYNQGAGLGDLYNQYFYGAANTPSGGQRQELGRYSPPMLEHFGTNQVQGKGGYSYNLPNNFGPYVGGYGSGQPGTTQAGYMGGGNNVQGYMPFMPKANGLYYQGQQAPQRGQGGPMPYMPRSAQNGGPDQFAGRIPRMDSSPQYQNAFLDQMGGTPTMTSISGAKPGGAETQQFNPMGGGSYAGGTGQPELPSWFPRY